MCTSIKISWKSGLFVKSREKAVLLSYHSKRYLDFRTSITFHKKLFHFQKMTQEIKFCRLNNCELYIALPANCGVQIDFSSPLCARLLNSILINNIAQCFYSYSHEATFFLTEPKFNYPYVVAKFV